MRGEANLSLCFRSRLRSAAGGNLLALLASRVFVGHWDPQGYPEEVMIVVADATVGIAGSHRHVQWLSESAFNAKHIS